MIGGQGGTQALLRYDPKKDTWTKLTALQESRSHLAAVALDGKIYALAGPWDGKVSRTIEVYDPATDKWIFGDPMQTARSGFGAAVIGEHIFVAGGEVLEGNAKTLSSVEVYHPTLHKWEFVPALPAGMQGMALVSYFNTLYVVGGSDRALGVDHRGRVLRYDVP